MKSPEQQLIDDFLQWFKKDVHSEHEDYYENEIGYDRLQGLSREEFIEFFFEFAKAGGKIQTQGARTAGKFKEMMESSYEAFKNFVLEPFSDDFKPVDWLGRLHEFKFFGAGLATIYLNRVDKSRFAIVNNKSRKAIGLFDVHVPTDLVKSYEVIRESQAKLIEWFPQLGNFYRADALTHYLIAVPEGKEWAERLSPGSSKTYWVYAPGPGAQFWEEFRRKGVMGVGWDELNEDLSAYDTEKALRKTYNKSRKDQGTDQDFGMLKDFLFSVTEGDYVFAKNGMGVIVGFGEVTSDYFFQPEKSEYRHSRNVKWTHSGYWTIPEGSTKLAAKTLTRLSDQQRIKKLLNLIDVGPSDDDRPPYSLEQCQKDTLHPLERLRRWAKAIRRKKQAVFYGPPGTGKTFIAEHLAKHLTGGGSGFVDLIQFHPAYAYEDFIQGIRPTALQGGAINYEMMNGRFKDFCDRARETTDPCVLIIDEINRANLSRVFGELMYLLEYRDKDIPLAGGERFSIPSNVVIIGTMNTADRSIALVDHALRRRFAFLGLYPDYHLLKAFHERTGHDVSGLIQILKQLNTRINDLNYHVGDSYFLQQNLFEVIEDVWSLEIEPYLEEFFFDQHDVVAQFRWSAIKDKILP